MMRNIVFLTMLFFTRHCLGGVLIATSSDFTDQQLNAVNKLEIQLSYAVNSTRVRKRDVSHLTDLNSDHDIIIAPGMSVLSALLHGTGKTPVIGIFIAPENFREVTEGVDTSRNRTAIYSTPSPRRQLALARALFGFHTSVGVLTTSSVSDSLLADTAKSLGIPLRFLLIESQRDFSHSIKKDKHRITSLLLRKDKALFEKLPLDRLINMAYEIRNLGVIGYSSGVVNNGGIATTYASIQDTAQSIAVLVNDTKSLPPPDYPSFYSIAINRYVMRSLGIPEKSPEALKKEIMLILRGKESSDV